jgi:hypothetical protein
MKSPAIALAFFLAFAVPAAMGQGRHDRQGKSTPDSASRKSADGFGGWIIVTSDADWRQKWDTPANVTPRFNTAKSVTVGGKLTVLIFFSNPKLDSANVADVTCDLKVVRPDGTVSTDVHNMECYKGPIRGNPANVYLSKAAVQFVAESTDVPGVWSVRVNLKDNLRRVSLPLETTYSLLHK